MRTKVQSSLVDSGEQVRRSRDVGQRLAAVAPQGRAQLTKAMGTAKEWARIIATVLILCLLLVAVIAVVSLLPAFLGFTG